MNKRIQGNRVRVEPYGVIQCGLRKLQSAWGRESQGNRCYTEGPWLLGPSSACHSNPSSREPAPILFIEQIRNHPLFRQAGPTTRRPKGNRECTRESREETRRTQHREHDLNLLVGEVAFWEALRLHPRTRDEYAPLVVVPCRPYDYRAPVPIL